MTDPDKSQTIDSDLPYYCAYCLPGVLQALGKHNWPILKTTFDLLSGDMQVLVCMGWCVQKMWLCRGQTESFQNVGGGGAKGYTMY